MAVQNRTTSHQRPLMEKVTLVLRCIVYIVDYQRQIDLLRIIRNVKKYFTWLRTENVESFMVNYQITIKIHPY